MIVTGIRFIGLSIFAFLMIYVVLLVLVRRDRIPYCRLEASVEEKLKCSHSVFVKEEEIERIRNTLRSGWLDSIKLLIVGIIVAYIFDIIKGWIKDGFGGIEGKSGIYCVVLTLFLMVAWMLCMRDRIPTRYNYVSLPGYIVRVVTINYGIGASHGLRLYKVVYYDAYKQRFYRTTLESMDFKLRGEWVNLLMRDKGDFYKPMLLMSQEESNEKSRENRRARIRTNFALTRIQNSQKLEDIEKK